jgi:hypothetical protein
MHVGVSPSNRPASNHQPPHTTNPPTKQAKKEEKLARQASAKGEKGAVSEALIRRGPLAEAGEAASSASASGTASNPEAGALAAVPSKRFDYDVLDESLDPFVMARKAMEGGMSAKVGFGRHGAQGGPLGGCAGWRARRWEGGMPAKVGGSCKGSALTGWPADLQH